MTENFSGASTGACAAAAAKAAALWITAGECPERVDITLPDGQTLWLDVLKQDSGALPRNQKTPLKGRRPLRIPFNNTFSESSRTCGVVKKIKKNKNESDATDGLTVIACVEILDCDGPVEFHAGEGVGTVTLPGLKIPVGEPAINPVPRVMIEKSLREVVKDRAVSVTISIPGGDEAAKRTFNPRLGVVGGLSILGTRGTVRPMDEQALRDSLTLELNTHAEAIHGVNEKYEKYEKDGGKIIALTFGGTGEAALRKGFGITGRCVVQVGNLIGFVLDEAERLGFGKILLCGHPGKLLKVSAGSFNTHNRVADGRMEALCAHAALIGMEPRVISGLYGCATTESAVDMLRGVENSGLLWNRLAEAAAQKCADRSRGRLAVAAAFVDNSGVILGKSAGADAMALELKQRA